MGRNAMGIPNQMTYIERIRSMFQPKSADERIADAIDAAVVEITYICADDQSQRITTAIGVLAAMLRSNVPPDGHEHALQMAMNHTARLLGVDAPAIDSNAVNFKRQA